MAGREPLHCLTRWMDGMVPGISHKMNGRALNGSFEGLRYPQPLPDGELGWDPSFAMVPKGSVQMNIWGDLFRIDPAMRSSR